MIELSEELKLRKEEWRKAGFLLPNDQATKGREYNFELFGRTWIAEIRTSTSGYWDDYISNGSVHTHSLALRKVRYMSDEVNILVAKQIVFFKWVVAWASWNTKTGDQ